MKPKHFIAFLCILGSLCWFSVMTASQMETLTTPHARFIFLWSFMVAIGAGVVALCFLFIEMAEVFKNKNETKKEGSNTP